MVSEATGADCPVESMRHPWKQFRWWFLRLESWLRCRLHASPVVVVSLMIYESLGVVSAFKSMCHPSNHYSRWFLRPEGLFAMSNPCLTCGSSFVDDFWGHMGYLRCRIHASPVQAIFINVFWVRCDSVLLDDFWAHMGSLRCRINASPVEVVSLMIF